MISREAALEIEARLKASADGGSGVLKPNKPSFLASFFSGPSGASHCFLGEDFIQWALQQGDLNPDAKESRAIALGQALIDHRIAHHVTDDFDFTNNAARTQRFALLSQETERARALHAELGAYVADPGKFPQGDLQWKQRDGSFLPVFAVLPGSPNNRDLLLYKRRSAASAPVHKVEGMISCEECLDCAPKTTDWTCFSVQTEAGKGKETFCAAHSSKQEFWLQKLAERGIEFKPTSVAETNADAATSLFDFEARLLNSEEVVKFNQYKGKVCLVVNVASKCGFTKRDYTELVAMRNELKEEGFEVLAFPSNEFGGGQEPGSEQEISEFTQREFSVTFPIFGKTRVNGVGAHPLFTFLRQRLPGTLNSSIKWNFTKFLCDRDGLPVKRYAPTVAPSALKRDVVELLRRRRVG